MRTFNQGKAFDYINNLLLEKKIKAIFTNKKSGQAFHYSQNTIPVIEIPNPNSIEKFGIALHEIGHIVLGHCETISGDAEFSWSLQVDVRPQYIKEYEAEQFAINHLKSQKLNIKRYETGAKIYVLDHILKCQDINSKLPIEITQWLIT